MFAAKQRQQLQASQDEAPNQFCSFNYLQMVGNPDQQEDNVDEQYQEEGEEEVINHGTWRCTEG